MICEIMDSPDHEETFYNVYDVKDLNEHAEAIASITIIHDSIRWRTTVLIEKMTGDEASKHCLLNIKHPDKSIAQFARDLLPYTNKEIIKVELK